MKINAMGKALAVAGALSLGMVLAPVAAQAQDSAGAQQEEDITWANVVMTRFHSGKRARALEIIKNYFAKADQMSGNKSGVHGIHLDTGEWDMIYVFPMKGVPATWPSGLHPRAKSGWPSW